MGQLAAGWPENLGRASEVVHNCDRQYLDAHLLLYFSTGSLVPIRLLELRNCVVIFIGEFPPLGAELADVAVLVSFETLVQC